MRSVRKQCKSLKVKFANGALDLKMAERIFTMKSKVNDHQRIVTDELVANVVEKIPENRRFAITEFSFSYPQISWSFFFLSWNPCTQARLLRISCNMEETVDGPTDGRFKRQNFTAMEFQRLFGAIINNQICTEIILNG